MGNPAAAEIEEIAIGLGWPEGPTVMPDGRIVLVESYRSQLTSVDSSGRVSRFAYVAGAPNSCVLGSDGALYVCQNGGTVGPWRAAEMSVPSIQRVRPGGKAEILELPKVGLKGNTHIPFTDLNNVQVADQLSAFLKKNKLDLR